MQLPIHPNDDALIRALKAGDAAAYEQLVRTHGGRMLATARRYLSDEEARDAVQDAFVSAFKAIDRFDGRAQIGTWLHRIVVNSSLMRIRKAKTRREEALEPLLPGFLEDGHRSTPEPAWPADAEARIGRAQTRQAIRSAIERLPEGYRNVLMLRDIEGLSGAETAAQMGISPGAVKVRLHRARQALRALLDPAIRGAE